MRFGLLAPKGVAWEDPRVRIAIQRSINFKGIGELLSNQANFEAEGITVEMVPMGHVPIHPGYYLNPEKGELGALSENYLFNVAEAKKLTAAAGQTGAIELPYYVLAERGEVAEADQLVLDSLGAAGTFTLKIHRSQTSTEHRRYRSLLEQDGIVAQSSTDEDADYFVYRDYHSLGRVGSEGIERIPFPYPEIDKVAEAQRREINPQKRFEHLKEFQSLAAKYMPAIPGRHQFTTFQFRWPWLRSFNNGQPVEASIPDGRPIWGGHKQWLAQEMPNRDKGAT
jgi:ABC-type transport system substrate-binding protein